MLIWVVTSGIAGMESQALGLASAMSDKVVVKRIHLRFPWRQLAPYVRFCKSLALSKSSDSLTPPWPDIVIACGRQSVLPSLYVRAKSAGRTKIIYLQEPLISHKHFDAVVCPQHDSISGNNVFKILGATHRVTEQKIKEELEKFSYLKQYKGHKIAVIIGGPNKRYKFNEKFVDYLAQKLNNLQKQYEASLFIVSSRRTPDFVISGLKSKLDETNTYYSCDDKQNPYLAILGVADVILVTCDSVSMISEVCSTTSSVYLIKLPGVYQKFDHFHQALLNKKRIHWLEDSLAFDKQIPLNETEQVASKLLDFFGFKRLTS